MSESIRLSREQLYELVWSEPLTKIAASLKLSDVGLAKLCRRHKVPTPYRGYWARLANGQRPSKVPLPAGRDLPQSITIAPTPPPLPPPESKLPPDLLGELQSLLQRETALAPKDQVAATLHGAHPLVQVTKKALGDLRVDKYGRLSHRAVKDALDVLVGPEMLSRALRIFDALIKGAIRRGYEIKRGEHRPLDTIVRVRQKDIHVRIEEPSRALPKDQVKVHEIRHREPWAWTERLEQTHAPTGVLLLKISNVYRAPVQSTWTDTATRPIEECVTDFFRSALVLAFEHEAEERIRVAERRRHEARQRLTQEQQAAAKQFEELAAQDARVSTLRDFLSKLDKESIGMEHRVGSFTSWREWAHAYIAALDPVVRLKAGELRLVGKSGDAATNIDEPE